MADLAFRQGIATTYQQIAFTKVGQDVLIGNTLIGEVIEGDVIRITYTDSYEKGLYAVCITPATGEFKFDSNIYNDVPNSLTAVVKKYNNADVYTTNSYRIALEIENGLYSKAYLKYASTVSYSLIIPTKRNEYFGSVSTIATSSDVVFVDLCDNKAYGVGFSDGSFDTLNNKFKSSLEFNIATR